MAGSDDDSYEERSKRLQSRQDDQDRLRRELRDEFGHGGSIFGAFKRFVDDSVSTLTDDIRNFSSNIAELRTSLEREKYRHIQEQADIERRWMGLHGAVQSSPPEPESPHVSERVKWALDKAAHLNAHVPLAKIVKLYEDKEAGMGLLDSLASPLLALGGTWYFLPETGDTLPTASNWTLRGNGARWLSVDWFKRSPYSPIRLEAHPVFQHDGAKWRMAFEDLMLAALDKPMSDNRPSVTNPWMQRYTFTPGVDWMFDLQHRGILPPLLPRFYGDSKARRVLEHTSILDVISSCKVPPTAEQSFPWIDSLSRDFTELTTEMAQSEVEYEDDPDGPRVGSIYDQRSNQQLQDYQMQLMKLESLDKKRKLQAGMDLEAPSFPDDDDEDEEDEEEEEEAVYGALYQRERAKQLQAMQRMRDEAGLDLSDKEMETWEVFGPRAVVQLRDKDAVDKVEQLLRKYYPEGGAHEIDDDETELMVAMMCSWLDEVESKAELSEKSESWEQQEENLEVMVGERKAQEPVEIVEEKLPEVPGRFVVEHKRPNVLSALTTTQTTRLPDGTVTTKVVLKKRFADGREETSESVHTTNEKVEAELRRRDQEEVKTNSQGGKGWFWS